MTVLFEADTTTQDVLNWAQSASVRDNIWAKVDKLNAQEMALACRLAYVYNTWFKTQNKDCLVLASSLYDAEIQFHQELESNST